MSGRSGTTACGLGVDSVGWKMMNAMMKVIALLLIGAHAFGLAQATPCTRGAHGTSACEHAPPLSDTATLDAEGACDACGMPECRDMTTCTATATALTSASRVSWIPSALRARELASTRTVATFERTPTRPPPRA